MLKSFKKILEYMYTMKIAVSEDDVFSILSAADYFLIKEVWQFCLSALQTFLTPSNAVEYFQAAHFYNDERLMQSTSVCISNNLSSVRNDLNECSLDVFEKLLLGLLERIDHYQCFLCLKQWIEKDIADRKRYFEQIMKHFR